MNVPATNVIRLSADPVSRAGWRCPSCGVNYSPDLTFCYCTAVPALPPPVIPIVPLPVISISPYQVTNCTCPTAWNGITAPPPCPAHGMTTMIRVTC